MWYRAQELIVDVMLAVGKRTATSVLQVLGREEQNNDARCHEVHELFQHVKADKYRELFAPLEYTQPCGFCVRQMMSLKQSPAMTLF